MRRIAARLDGATLSAATHLCPLPAGSVIMALAWSYDVQVVAYVRAAEDPTSGALQA